MIPKSVQDPKEWREKDINFRNVQARRKVRFNIVQAGSGAKIKIMSVRKVC